MVANLFSLIGTKIHSKYLKKYDSIIKLKYSLILIMILSLIMGISNIYMLTINSTPKEYKSTMFSIINVVMEIAFIISYPIITYIILKTNIKYTYVFVSINIFIILIFINIIDIRNKRIYKNSWKRKSQTAVFFYLVYISISGE